MKIASLFLPLLITASATAQVNVQLKGPAAMVIIESGQANTLKTDMKSFILNPSRIEAVTVLKGSSAIQAYGNLYKDGIVIIKTKEELPLVRLKTILDKYKIAAADRKLRVCIDKSLVSDPEIILADLAEIEDVEITTDRNLMIWENADNTERFINIRTHRNKPVAL